MTTIMKSLVVGLFLFPGLGSAQAGQRHYDYRDYTQRHTGLSFGIVIGASVTRHPVRVHYRQPAVRGCSPRQVSAIASSYGIDYQTIYRNARTMTVVGYRHGRQAQICFSRAPDCHIIR